MEIVFSVVRYTANFYTREPPTLLFALDGGGGEVVESARDSHQGCYLNLLCYSAGALSILKELKPQPPIPEDVLDLFIYDLTVILPPELSLDRAATEKTTEWPQERLGLEGHSLNQDHRHVWRIES